MMDVLDDDVVSLLRLATGDPEPVLESMAEYGRERDFPIVGPDVGRFLRVAARLGAAERVFEFGSGFGYSAVWFAGALPETGAIHLTDYDEENLERARTFMREAGHDDLARYHEGDAQEAFDATTGTFDVVLIDHEKARYPEAFAAVRDRLETGGVVIADNAMAGPVTPTGVAAALAGEVPADDRTAGVSEYLATVRDDHSFDTVLLPLGEGIAVSVRR